MVSGLKPKEVRQGTMKVDFHNVPVHVLNPIILLKAKSHNVLHIDQRNRQDEKHVRILVPCIRAFIRRLLKEALSTGKMRPLLNALELVIQTTSHCELVSAAKQLGLDLKQSLPLLEIEKCRIPQVVNFVTHRLPHWRWLAKAKPPEKPNQD